MRALVVGLVAVLAAGCSSASMLRADNSTSGPSQPGTGESESAAHGSAKQVLKQAVREFVLADTGRFYSVVRYEEDGHLFTPIAATGAYQLSRRLADLTVKLNGGSGEELTIDRILTPNRSFVRVNDSEEPEPCWLQYSQRQARELQGIPSGAQVYQYPPGVTAVTWARGVEFAPDGEQVILGTTDLSIALALVFPMEKEALDELTRTNDTVRAEFELMDGELVAWRLAGADLVDALRAAEVKIDPQLGAAAPSVSAEVGFSGLGERVSISPPPEPQRVPFREAQSSGSYRCR